MNQDQQKHLKEKLEQELATFQKQQEENQRFGLDSGMNDSVGELSGYDNHPADLGSEMFERGKDLALQDASQQREEEIIAALYRMDQGKYGHCEICGQEIPYERLEILPWTRYCVNHSQDSHVASQRPIEENVMQQNQREQLERDDSGYNGEDAWQEVERYGTSNPPDFFRDGTSYNELTIEHDENRGYVDDVEKYAISELDGDRVDD